MKISEQWLREWVNVDADIDTIAERLTMLGLEVDGIEDAAAPMPGIVIGRIESAEPHPDADRLRVCRVDIGTGELLDIVCGAPNAAVGLVAPVATVGAILPGGTKIRAAKLRGVQSSGMLCSAAELGLANDTDGLWPLPADAPLGQPLASYLELPDRVLDIDLTPNRGDCLSLRGVAREVSAIFDCPFHEPDMPAFAPTCELQPAVINESPERCAGYAARMIQGITPAADTPLWIRERLRRSGVRSISLPVDIGNYVMLAFGQPMHAFDGDKLVGTIRVRQARHGEQIETLDGSEVTLDASTLVIADDEGAVAIAGMIGGLRTAVDDTTRNVVYECACFSPAAVAGQGRRYKIHTDSLHRYERGVDPALYPRAIEYATTLLVAAGGGNAGPVVVAEGQPIWAGARGIELSAPQIARLLGQCIEPAFVEKSLASLGLACRQTDDGLWQVEPPSWRYDLSIEADLIEEVARLYGYDRLQSEGAGVLLPPVNAQAIDASAQLRAASALLERGYSEAITYSFVEPRLHAALSGDAPAVVLDNPISDQMVEMRRSLWAGLLPVWFYNTRRQQARVRLFEHGLRFVPDASADNGIEQTAMLAGLSWGQATAAHWDLPPRPVDFFDVKGDVEALLAQSGGRPVFLAENHPALHPGRSARILLDGQPVGWVGQLAPAFSSFFKKQTMPYLFEIEARALAPVSVVRYEPPSEQPRVRRDLAVVVAESLAVGKILSTIREVGSQELESLEVFDVFRGEGLESGFKSVALGLIFQDKASTLTDDRVDRIISALTDALRTGCGARIRGE